MAKPVDRAAAADMRAVAAAPRRTRSAAKRLSAKSAFYNALLRTTCVAYSCSQGGHAENALPQTARATVNCRMLPDERAHKAVQQTLVRTVADRQIEIAPVADHRCLSPASPFAPEVGQDDRVARARPIRAGCR